MKPFYHVAVGVVYDKQGNILLTQRALDKHQGGKWEFAGGKVEQGETVQQALSREFDEELGVRPTHTRPLIKIPFNYPEHNVLLDVWEVFDFDGTAEPREGQAMQWVPPHQLHQFDFPPANQAIIRAALLPEYYLITPDDPMPLDVFTTQLRSLFALGIRLCRVRQGALPEHDYIHRVHAATQVAAECGTKIIIDGPVKDIWPEIAGWHLNSTDLYHYQERPVPQDKLLIASLHTQEDIVQADKINVDCSVLSPVKQTSSHPNVIPLGWNNFESLVAQAKHPVYALGGLTINDLLPARQHGAQGVAAVRGLWELKSRHAVAV